MTRVNLSTYRWFSLKPLLRKVMLALRTLSCAIYHPTDKGLGPYVTYQQNYMRQGIKEHLNNINNHTRLSPDEATAELAAQKKLFYEAFAKYKDRLSENLQQYFKRSFKKHSFLVVVGTRSSTSCGKFTKTNRLPVQSFHPADHLVRSSVFMLTKC